jgi:sulfur-oxidizing protein SoxY
MDRQDRTPALSRRHLLLGAGTGVLAAAALSIAPRPARADAPAVDEMLGKLTGGAQAKTGKVELKLPQIAENGNTVPFTVTVDSPMTESDYVKAIHVVADGNPLPGVASFYFTPLSGKAEVSSRMRLAKTQNIKAVAVMSDGSVYANQQEIKVTIGGCGG